LSEYCDEIDSDIADNKQRYDEEAMKNIELENKIEKLSEVIDDLKYYVDYYDIKEAKDLLKENNIPVRKGKSINETITFMIGNPQYEDEED
jgi:predicted ArsR family transcriptional regulator